MKNLETSLIATGKGYPLDKTGADYLYLSNKEMLNALAQSISGPIDGSSAYILYGCIKTDLGGDDFSFSAGIVYDSATEELYFLDAVASIEILIDPVIKITEANPAAFNPIKFEDGSDENPHKEKKLVISDGALGSKDINYEDLIDVSKFKPRIMQVDGAQTIPISTPAALIKLDTGQTVSIDTFSSWDGSLFRHVPKKTGFYEYSIRLAVSVGAVLSGDTLVVQIRKNGSNIKAIIQETYNGNAEAIHLVATYMVEIDTIGDYVDFTINISTNPAISILDGHLSSKYLPRG